MLDEILAYLITKKAKSLMWQGGIEMNSILKEVAEELETERLILRMPKPGDGTVVNAAITSSLDELKPWLPFALEEPSVEDTEINTREAYAKFIKRENLRYLIFIKENGEFVGNTGFHNIDWNVPKVEIGYWIDTKHSGKGYMREAVEKLTHFATDDLGCRRVEIQCESENHKSRAIPEKIGYQLDGILKNDDVSVDGNHLTHTCIYSWVK